MIDFVHVYVFAGGMGFQCPCNILIDLLLSIVIILISFLTMFFFSHFMFELCYYHYSISRNLLFNGFFSFLVQPFILVCYILVSAEIHSCIWCKFTFSQE